MTAVPGTMEELRAVWITTAASLDWPRSRTPQAQQEELLDMITLLRRENFNTIFFQVRARGDAYYRSSHEPWAENLTGSLGAPPGWDPLAFLVDHAHAAGLEVHAWVNLYKVSGPGFPEASTPAHIARAKPEWVFSYEGELWLNPGTAGVNDFLYDVSMEVVRNYDIDGIQFDFARYPGRNIPDQADYAAYGEGRTKDDWRRENIDRFLRTFYDSSTAAKPWLKVGATPVGNFGGNGRTDVPAGYSEVYQNAPGWMRSGSVDYIVPQIYWSLGESGSDPDFALLARRWAATGLGRHVYAGIAPYKPEILAELPEQIDSARTSGCSGQAFFRFRTLEMAALGDRYRNLAPVPVMRWKVTEPPGSPGQLAVTQTGTGSLFLEWSEPAVPPNGPGQLLRYNVYRSTIPHSLTPDPNTLIHTTERSIRHYTDSTAATEPGPLYYVVTAVHRFSQEGSPSPVVSSTLDEIREFRTIMMAPVAMSAMLDSTDSGILIAYRLPEEMPVTILFQQDARNATNPLVETVVGEIQQGGIHLLKLDRHRYPAGEYFVILRAGGVTINKPISLR
ncbi:MAG: family 10 glycosylhydrolase [Ignavibacteria bacterium]|nr:family 10 glycosylhydrolase [Ignavibacteria bacterium]